MNTKTTYVVIGIIIFVSFALGIYRYPALPERVASHWGTDGQVNGTMGKFWGIFLAPFVMTFMTALLTWLPKIDPMKENIASFRKQYDGIILALVVFFFYIQLLTLAWNLGYTFDMTRMIVPALAALFFGLGVALPKTKQNWFMGIRTPWTLSSPIVWEETHVFGGKVFKLAAVLALVGLCFPDYIIWFILIPALFAAFGTMIYSYYSFKKHASH